MEEYCFVYDKETDRFTRYSKFALSSMSKDSPEKLIIMRKNIYKYKNFTCPLELVLGGKGRFGFRHKNANTKAGFKRKNKKNNTTAHHLVQEVLYEIDDIVFKLRDTKEELNVTINKVEFEKEVVINGKKYYSDLYFEINQQINENTNTILPSKIFFEIVDTHDLDEEKIIDYRIMGLSLVRYLVTENFKNYHGTKDLSKERKTIFNSIYRGFSNRSILIDNIDNTTNDIYNWKISKNNRLYLSGKNFHYTIMENNDCFKLACTINNKQEYIKKYNGKILKDIEYIKNVVHYKITYHNT